MFYVLIKTLQIFCLHGCIVILVTLLLFQNLRSKKFECCIINFITKTTPFSTCWITATFLYCFSHLTSFFATCRYSLAILYNFAAFGVSCALLRKFNSSNKFLRFFNIDSFVRTTPCLIVEGSGTGVSSIVNRSAIFIKN